MKIDCNAITLRENDHKHIRTKTAGLDFYAIFVLLPWVIHRAHYSSRNGLFNDKTATIYFKNYKSLSESNLVGRKQLMVNSRHKYGVTTRYLAGRVEITRLLEMTIATSPRIDFSNKNKQIK